jgi:hypothetical protein
MALSPHGPYLFFLLPIRNKIMKKYGDSCILPEESIYFDGEA